MERRLDHPHRLALGVGCRQRNEVSDLDLPSMVIGSGCNRTKADSSNHRNFLWLCCKLAIFAIGITVQLLLPISESMAQSKPRVRLSCNYGECYSYHQCMINSCAGYQVNCWKAWYGCGSNYGYNSSNYCYGQVSGYIIRQYGPIPKYCARR